ncbi:MAG TPA: ribonuclease H family protein [Bacteroidales bacterium]|nr:ribonuclease H family protein [Bacteroidales bacterium]
MTKPKFYTVWAGHKTGVFNSWEACREAVSGFEGALYKSFGTLQLAEKAFNQNPYLFIGRNSTASKPKGSEPQKENKPILNSISVDAACNMVTGQMEYQGVYTHNKEVLFRQGPFPKASNNIGEFLALVHALALCKQKSLELPIYSDSKTAIAWLRNKHAKTKVEQNDLNETLFQLVDRAQKWLKENTWKNKVLKWETEFWGEIPADFGRK